MVTFANSHELILFIWHIVCLFICFIILIYALFYIIFRRYVMTTMTKAAVQYSIIGVLLFILTLVSSFKQVLSLQNALIKEAIKLYITNSLWTAAHIFTYLLFFNRLEYSFITKYKVTKTIKWIFKICIVIWAISEVLMALNQAAFISHYHSHKRSHTYNLILVFVIQMVDLLVSVYLILLFLRNLYKIAFDQKIKVSSIDHTMSERCVIGIYDEDIVNEIIEITQPNPVSNDVDDIKQSDYLLLSE
eukprot:1046652_1